MLRQTAKGAEEALYAYAEDISIISEAATTPVSDHVGATDCF